MARRRLTSLLFALALLLPEPGARPAGAERFGRRPDRPNVLVIIGDDHAAGTLGIDGDPRSATPRLDALARQGVRFDRAFCNAPVCTASRQSLLTGRMPHAVGVTQLMTALPESTTTMAEWLARLGYATGAIGKMHFNGPADHGFAFRVDAPDWQKHLRQNPPAGGDRRRKWRPFVDHASVWLNAEARPAGLPVDSMEATYFADRAAGYFRDHADEPLLLFVGFHEPHSPFTFPDEWAGRFRPDQFEVPAVSEADRAEQPWIFSTLSPAEIRGIQAAYYTSLNFLDHQVGRVLDALDATGLADDTIVVYVGDNGYFRGHHGRFEKHAMYEEAVRVPLIVRWPGHFEPGRRVTELVELVDLVPTLAELIGEPPPSELHGTSLIPLLTGQPGAKGRDVVVSLYTENEEAMARSDRYKLIVSSGSRRRRDGYETGRPLPGPYEKLFDLEADPDESTDLIGRPEFAGVADGLRKALLERLAATRGDSPPAPEGLDERESLSWYLVPRDVAPPDRR